MLPAQQNPTTETQRKRRREVVNAASRLIMESGLESVTVRKVAEETGYSTAIVTKYFSDKTEMLLFIFRHGTTQIAMRLLSVGEKSNSTIQDVLECVLPLDDTRRTEWAVYLAFWGRCVTDPNFADEQRVKAQFFRDAILKQFKKTPPPSGDNRSRRLQAESLATFVTGLATVASIDAKFWPPKRQRHFLRLELRRQGYL